MIYDCFSFFNELDLLEIRLNVLKDVVDKFVLVEATRTHTGRPKPLYYEENKARYAAFADRIIHIVVDDFSAAEGLPTVREKAWAYENIQRNAIAKGLVGAKPDDMIVISDVDEIPDPQKLLCCVKNSDESYRFEQKNYCYYLNMRSYPTIWWRAGSVMISYGRMANDDLCDQTDRRYAESVVQSVNEGNTITKIKRCLKTTILVRGGGWHYSYLGGEKMVMTKLQNIVEGMTAMGDDELLEYARLRIRRGEDVLMRGGRMFAERLGEGTPRYIIENVFRFQKLIFPLDTEYLKSIRWAKVAIMIKGAVRELLLGCVPTALLPVAVRVRDRLCGRKFVA